MLVDNRIPWAHVVRRHSFSLAAILVAATGASFLEASLVNDLPGGPLLAMPVSFVGVAVMAFLGFRNNAAYDRYWEGRKLWGGLVNASRSFARQVTTLISAPAGAPASVTVEVMAAQRALVHGCIAYIHALRCSLRGEDPWATIEPVLPADALPGLRRQRNVPAAIAQLLGRQTAAAAARGWLTEQRLQTIDRTLTELVSLQGGCERILNTPLPAAYSRVTHRMVQAYCLVLPFCLVENLHFLTILVSYLVGFVFILLDSIGQELEHPFGAGPLQLPLAALATTIEINLRQALDEEKAPASPRPVDGVLV